MKLTTHSNVALLVLYTMGYTVHKVLTNINGNCCKINGSIISLIHEVSNCEEAVPGIAFNISTMTAVSTASSNSP